MNDEYTLKELTPEEAKNVTKELQDVLAKYECEMGVSSTINIMKRQPVPKPSNGTDSAKDNPSSTPA